MYPVVAFPYSLTHLLAYSLFKGFIMVDINITTIMAMLSQLIGVEGAEKIMNEAIGESSLARRQFYTEGEFQKICGSLRSRGGAIKLFADLVMTSDYREKQYQKIIDQERKEKEDLSILYGKLEELNRDLLISNEKLRLANESMNRMQQDLVRAEKLAAIGHLASSIAHEVRNPLASIMNVSYYLKRYIETRDPRVRELLDILSSEISRTNRIISDLLDFSQLRVTAATPVLVHEEIDECVSELNLGDRKITFIREYSPDVKEVSADPDGFRKILRHLLSNAVEAIDHQGTVTVSTSAFSSENTFRLTVKDTGCGMDPDIRQHIFEPLFTTKTKGIGLGLPTIKNIIESHGGTLTVESDPSAGSTFTVTIPLIA